MIRVDIRNLAEVQAALRNLAEEQIPFATKSALNDTAFAVQKVSRTHLESAFDRPTPLIKGATRVEQATKKTQVARVLIDPKRAPVLNVHEQGGPRGDQRLEKFLQGKGWLPAGWRAIPTRNMPLNAYGNPKQTDVTLIINGLPDAGGGSGFPKYFVVPAPDRNRGRLPAGIYLALTSFYVSKLYHFFPRAQYGPDLKWLPTMRAEVQRILPGITLAAVRRAIETAR